MKNSKQYTIDDLQTFKLVKFSQENGVTSHTHVVEFGRPLTEAELDLFKAVLTGFYYTVRFSHQFGGDFVSEPTIECVTPQTLHYTLHQRSLSGSWKDLLFVLLANFSNEVVPMIRHDVSRVFDPARTRVMAS